MQPAVSQQARSSRLIARIGGPVLAALSYVAMTHSGNEAAPSVVLAITTLCAVWWIFEAIPLAITALVPLALFPLFGVLSAEDIAASFGHQIVLLILGGFMLSAALVKNDAHRQLALLIVNLIGAKSGVRLVVGFMGASALLSMWISNVATAIMLVPVALAIVEQGDMKKLAVPLLLSICYGASVGGIGTPIGSPTNLIFVQAYAEATGTTIGFIDWMKLSIPVVVVLLIVVGWRLMGKTPRDCTLDMPSRGEWSASQLSVIGVFGLTALLWMTRSSPFGGWSAAVGLPHANDATVALVAVVVLSALPNDRNGKLLDWEAAKTIPWDVLLLLGGAIALSKAFSATGLSDILAAQFAALSALPVIVLLFIVCFTVIFATELVSNTAIAAIFMPVLAAVGAATDVEVHLLMLPAVMCASCAFMMPFATGPNAVVFGSGRVPFREMIRYGLVLNLLCTPIVVIACYFLLS